MKNILVVDDDSTMRAVIKDGLSGDYAVVSAENGRKALELLANQDFDLIILDVMMPEMDGIELILALRPTRPKQRLIAISGGSDIGGQFDCLGAAKKLGDCLGLRKPFQMTELRMMVCQLLA